MNTCQLLRRIAVLFTGKGILFMVLLFMQGISFAQEKQETQPNTGEIKLSDAVADFNRKASSERIGKTQPALTEDEVVAAIRCWDRKRYSVSDEVYSLYLRIADTRMMPKNAMLSYTSGLESDGYHFEVWWIYLDVTLASDTGFSYRLRSQIIRCRKE
jgi:hypothetical protein